VKDSLVVVSFCNIFLSFLKCLFISSCRYRWWCSCRRWGRQNCWWICRWNWKWSRNFLKYPIMKFFYCSFSHSFYPEEARVWSEELSIPVSIHLSILKSTANSIVSSKYYFLKNYMLSISSINNKIYIYMIFSKRKDQIDN
jgi:hypothetical protein